MTLHAGEGRGNPCRLAAILGEAHELRSVAARAAIGAALTERLACNSAWQMNESLRTSFAA